MWIKATGKKGPLKITIEVSKEENGKYDFEISGCDSIFYDNLLDDLNYELKKQHIFAGTYVPPVKSDINILNVLSEYYFDEAPEIEAKDIEPMPNVEGRIY